jgi:hypothetical protein
MGSRPAAPARTIAVDLGGSRGVPRGRRIVRGVALFVETHRNGRGINVVHVPGYWPLIAKRAGLMLAVGSGWIAVCWPVFAGTTVWCWTEHGGGLFDDRSGMVEFATPASRSERI